MCSAKRPVELSPAGLSPIRPAINQRNKAMKRISAGKETLGEIDRLYDVIRWTMFRVTSSSIGE